MLKKLHILICVILLMGISWISRSPAQERSENILPAITLTSLQSGEEELYYDDGKPSESLLGTSGDPVVFSVCFTPSSYPCTLKKVKFNLSWVENHSFKMHVYQQENDSTPPGPELIESFTTQASETGWYTHDISDLNVTIQSGNFAIGIEISGFGFFLYVDEDLPIANRSWSSTNPDAEESSWKLNDSYNFMIRAIVEYTQPAITTTTTIGPSTTTTTKKYCPSKEIYGEDSEETELLRYFRDDVLNKTPEGQEIIKLYYKWSPAIVKIMEEDEEFKEEVKEMIDGVLLLMGDPKTM